jgi:hypothetical protein
MIKELALTPHIFDEESNQDRNNWSDQLSRLGERIRPWGSVSHFVISDLCENGWKKTAGNYVKEIKSSVKDRAMDLYTRIEPLLVSRNLLGDWPGDDEELWAQQALNVSDSGPVPLDRIVATPNTAKSHKGVNAISDVTGNGFWNGLAFDASIPMAISEQMKRLKTLCYHAGYISISSAYFRNGTACETDFLKAFIEMVCSTQRGNRILFIDVHCQASSGSITQDSPEVQGVIDELQGLITRDVQVNLFYWSKIRERIMLAGDKTTVSGEIQMKVRWGITMQHMATSRDARAGDRTYWHHLGSSDILFWNNQFYHQKPLLGPITISRNNRC